MADETHERFQKYLADHGNEVDRVGSMLCLILAAVKDSQSDFEAYADGFPDAEDMVLSLRASSRGHAISFLESQRLWCEPYIGLVNQEFPA